MSLIDCCEPVKTLMRDGGTSDQFDHQQWKAMQRIMSDTVRFVEQLHNIPWEDGIAPEVIAGITLHPFTGCWKLFTH